MDDAIQEGLDSSPQPLEVMTEFFDTKRHDLDAIEPFLVDLLTAKYRSVETAVVVVTDNDAFDFVSRHRSIFANAPVVFAGINNFEPEWAPPGSNITGVVEAADLRGTIALIRRLQPDLAELAVVSDEVSTGKLHRAAVIDLFDSNDPVVDGLVLNDLSGITAGGLALELGRLGSDAAVLHMSLYKDTAGRPFTAEDGIAFVVDRTTRPVYVLWDFMVVNGAIGGHVMSGAEQGRVAAELALDVVDGVPISRLPVITVSPNETVLDWNAFKAKGLDPSSVEGEARFMGRPPSLYQQYRRYVWGAVATIAVLVVAVVVGLAVIGHLRHIQQHLMASRAQIRDQNRRLTQLNADLSDFAFTASHDLKSPVLNALGSIQLAMIHIDHHEPDEANGLLERAITSCERIVHRVEALMRFAVGDPHARTPVPVDFSALVVETWQSFDVPDSIVLIQDHRSQEPVMVVRSVLSMVLDNLLSNAVKHRDPTAGQGSVSVRSWRQGERFVFSVEDDGVGISEADYANVGRPFCRFGDPVIEGSGLGLMLVKHYLTRIGGHLHFTSEPGRGTTFVVDLPADPTASTGTEMIDVDASERDSDANFPSLRGLLP